MTIAAPAIILTGFVTLVAILITLGFAILVGRTRGRVRIDAPAMSGHPDLERALRIQGNTVEQIVIFLPALWSFAIFISPVWAAGLGIVFIVGRLLYFTGYTKSAEKRSLGFSLSMFPTLFLLIGGLFGAVRAALG